MARTEAMYDWVQFGVFRCGNVMQGLIGTEAMLVSVLSGGFGRNSAWYAQAGTEV